MTENLKTRYRCPSCKTHHNGSEHRHLTPFCSERCQLVDLGSWMQESYSIPATALEEDSKLSTDSAETPTPHTL